MSTRGDYKVAIANLCNKVFSLYERIDQVEVAARNGPISVEQLQEMVMMVGEVRKYREEIDELIGTHVDE